MGKVPITTHSLEELKSEQNKIYNSWPHESEFQLKNEIDNLMIQIRNLEEIVVTQEAKNKRFRTKLNVRLGLGIILLLSSIVPSLL